MSERKLIDIAREKRGIFMSYDQSTVMDVLEAYEAAYADMKEQRDAAIKRVDEFNKLLCKICNGEVECVECNHTPADSGKDGQHE